MLRLIIRAEKIREALVEAFPGTDLRAQQVIALAEEVGEFVGAARRFMGMARRPGGKTAMAEELADVVIAAFVTAGVFDINLPLEIDHKMSIIMSRGWREVPDWPGNDR